VQVYEGVIARRPDMAIAYRHLAFVQWSPATSPRRLPCSRKRAPRASCTAASPRSWARIFAEAGRPADAVRLLQPLLGAPAASVPDADALNALGIAYARSGRSAEARAVFEQLLALNAESAMALEISARWICSATIWQSAARHFADAVRVDPYSSQAQAGVGVVSLRTGDRPTAIAAWTKAVELDRHQLRRHVQPGDGAPAR